MQRNAGRQYRWLGKLCECQLLLGSVTDKVPKVVTQRFTRLLERFAHTGELSSRLSQHAN